MGQRHSRQRPPCRKRHRPRTHLCHPHIWAARVVALLCKKVSGGLSPANRNSVVQVHRYLIGPHDIAPEPHVKNTYERRGSNCA